MDVVALFSVWDSRRFGNLWVMQLKVTNGRYLVG